MAQRSNGSLYAITQTEATIVTIQTVTLKTMSSRHASWHASDILRTSSRHVRESGQATMQIELLTVELFPTIKRRSERKSIALSKTLVCKRVVLKAVH